MEGPDGRTERATSKRREEEREKGNLCVSQEVITVFVLLLGLLALRGGVPFMGAQLEALFHEVSRVPLGGTWNASLLQGWFVSGLLLLMVLLAPVFAATCVGAVAASMIQTGPYMSSETLSLKWSELNPLTGFKKLFSWQSVVSLVLSMAKVLLVVWILYLMLRGRVLEVFSLSEVSTGAATAWVLRLIFRFSITIVVLFVVIAVADWCYHKWKYERGMMMTKKEVEDERKNQEPSPVVRGAQRRKMRELTMQRMMAAVPNANVVITNPTHVAVALQYQPDSMKAPKVIAKGLRLVAERIKQIAAENNVPIIERPEVARELYKHVKVGREIPSRFYGAIAEILAYLYRLGQGRVRESIRSRAVAGEAR